MHTADLPTVNAGLNTLSTCFLTLGYLFIKNGRPVGHKRCMLAALGSSTFFLASYLIYHYHVGAVPYPRHDWTRILYFTILIPHVIMATVMVPFILSAVCYAWREEFYKHRQLARWVWPTWMFVSISGVAVYLMLYQL